MENLLTIGMATYDDYNGVYFTIQSLRMMHDICNTQSVEFIVIDGNPDSEHGKTTRHFLTSVKNAKYIEKREKPNSSFDKYKVVEHASGKYILIIDCHVLLQPNAINCLLDYYSKNENCKDLIQGPLWYDDLNNYSTHFDPGFRGHMYGTWATNQEKYKLGEPFEIPMQGMGLCSFEKSNWPGVNPHFIGFGAEEGYFAEKFRKNGGKNICIPQLKWVHRFGRPDNVPYRLFLEDRVWNYFIGWLEIYKDPSHQMIKQIYHHFKDSIPKGSIDIILNNAINSKEKWQ